MRMYAVLRRTGAVLGLLGALGFSYAVWVRPAQLRWGATDAELKRAMPEDHLVASPAFDATRAIIIRGRPEDIWPWLVQMGYDRAGFYGYDLIESLGNGGDIRSAERILPAFQNPHTGDVLPLSLAASLTFGTVEPNQCLVWRARDDPPSGVFVWQLVPVDSGHTRLISRIRWRYLRSSEGVALGIFTEFSDHVAVRAILQGVRDRVEGRPSRPLALQAVEIGAWLLTFLEMASSIVLVLAGYRWRAMWWFALAAAIFLQIELYASPSAWITAALPAILLALMVCNRKGTLHWYSFP